MEQSNELGEFLTVDEVAKRLKTSTKWVRGEIKATRLRAAKLGGIYRVTPDDLADFYESNIVEGPMKSRQRKGEGAASA